MKLIGLTKVKNEEKIIKETLDHWGSLCTGGIYVLDDCSSDNTREICRKHPAVKDVIEIAVWDFNRERAEWFNRQTILDRAQKDANSDDWFVYFDADERLYNFDVSLLFVNHIDAIACELYDVYITPEDVDKNHNERQWVGPEFRTIVFFFRNSVHIGFDKPDQRIVNLPPNPEVVVNGVIKHYGKGISVEHWEETCDYYINFWPKYTEKWQKRKGKAVHDYISDFNNKLIKFQDVLNGKEKGFSLELQEYGKK